MNSRSATALVVLAYGLVGCGGSDGEAGPTGVPGENGEPGAKGDTGLAGTDGEKGDTGDTGAKGDTGATGANGDSAWGLVGRRRHVILIVGDGMQMAHEVAASRYLYGTNQGLAWHSMPYRGYSTTWDVTTYNRFAYAASKDAYTPTTWEPAIGYDPAQGGRAPYPLADLPEHADDYFLTALPSWLRTTTGSAAVPATDSASAGTALSTGIKTDDGNIAWLPNDPADGAIATIAEQVRAERGMAIGVVSTVPFSHATPAAFVSHNVSRNNYYTGYKGLATQGIADEIIMTTKPDVVIGGGHPMMIDSNFSSTQDTTRGFISKAAYDALSSPSSPWVFVQREAGKDGGQALLSAATRAVSEKKPLFGLYGGAGGNFEYRVPVDNPGSPEVPTGSTENPTLSQGATAALEVLSADPDGFFLVIEQGDIDWANHDNNFANMVGCMADLEETVQTVLNFVGQPGDEMDWSNTFVVVTSDHGNSYLRLPIALGKGDLPAQSCASGTSQCTYSGGEVTYGTTGHTNELVTVSAVGFGTEFLLGAEGLAYPGTRIIDNTDIYYAMLRAAAL